MGYGCTVGTAKDGRRFVITGRSRTRGAFGKFYNTVSVAWLDEEGRPVAREYGPAGKFNKEHRPKYEGRRMSYDHGLKRYT